MGSSTSVIVNNWFSGGSNQLQDHGRWLKIDSQISQLVQAMATYSGRPLRFDPQALARSRRIQGFKHLAILLRADFS